MAQKKPDAKVNQQIAVEDRKSTRLNSSHLVISYAVFCLKKNKKVRHPPRFELAVIDHQIPLHQMLTDFIGIRHHRANYRGIVYLSISCLSRYSIRIATRI